jgi:flagellar brake protein
MTCQIPLPAFRSAVVAARVLDLSVGGLAIVAPSSRLNFEPGAEYRHCRLPLGDQGTLLVHLRVRYLFRVPSHGGVDVPRAGCQFIDMLPDVAIALRRYMLHTPRLT